VGSFRSFCCPPGTIPVVCFTDTVIPIVLACLGLDDVSSSDVLLPVIAVSLASPGRLAVFGNVLMFDRTSFEHGETAALILQIFLWLERQKSGLPRANFVGFSHELHGEIHKCFQGQGIRESFFEFEPETLSEEKMLIVSSAMNSEKHLAFVADFLGKGGGIGLVCVDYDSALACNSFLAGFGLAFACCSISDERGVSRTPSLVPQFDRARGHLFPHLVERFRSYVQNPSNDFALDNLVTAITYHIKVREFHDDDRICELVEIAWDFLRKTAYRTADNLIAPKVTHAVVIVFLEELWRRLPVERLGAHPDADLFPGRANSPVENSVDVAVAMRGGELVPTGWWLNAGVFGTIECPDPPEGLEVQVGVHSKALFVNEGPWHRWPSVQSSTIVQSGTTVVFSQFGGIVSLFVARELPSAPLHMTFSNFSRYPVVDAHDISVWDATRGFDAPWAEIICKTVIITLPSSELRKLHDVSKAAEFIENQIVILARIVHYGITRPYRIAFDVDCFGDPEAGYPISLIIADIPEILTRPVRPTPGLCRLLLNVAIASFPDCCFDPMTEKALASWAVSLTFAEAYGEFDPLNHLPIEWPVLFPEIWTIHTKIAPGAIAELLSRAQRKDSVYFDSPEDQWLNFVKTLSDLAKYNFVPLLKEVRLIPLSLAVDLEQYKRPKIVKSTRG
jgi:hypothetical protein